MQKLSERQLINTPTSASLARSSVVPSLNREETLSERSFSTSDNNPEVNNAHIQAVLKTNVYVLAVDGKPLMPCSRAKARKLLKNNKATIVKHNPFTIKLTFECENQIQSITLGVDTGYQHIGLSAKSEKAEYWSSEVVLRNISPLLTEKKMYRRGRRNKLWYRKPRFLNRKRKKGWLPPSIDYRINSHIKIIEKVCSLLPITSIIVEVANFDIQKLKNLEIKGVGYQQGDLYGYENIKSYLIEREHARCQLCHERSTRTNSFRVHHIIQKSKGGTDKPDNLALLHEKCHTKLHKENLGHLLTKNKQYKAETFMSIMRNTLVTELRNTHTVMETFGYITKIRRNTLNIEKSHINDAFVIAKGSNQVRSVPLTIIQKRHNNRCLQLNRKGFKPSVRHQRYPYQPKDVVMIQGVYYDVTGTFNKGSWIRVTKAGTVFNFSTKKVERHYVTNGWAIHPHPEGCGLLAPQG